MSLIRAHHHGVISLERLQSQLLLGLDPLLSQLGDLTGKDLLWRRGRVDTVCLDTDDNATTNLQELMGVDADNTSLIRLCDVGKDAVNHRHEHAVFQGVTGVFDDGDDVGAVSGHVDEITAGAVRELYCVDSSGRADDVSDVRDGGTRGSAQVEHATSGLHVDIFQTAQDTSRKLGAEGVPDAVFGLGRCGPIAIGAGARGGIVVDGDALLAVHRFTGGQVLSDEQVFLASCNEDAGMSVRFLYRGCQIQRRHERRCRCSVR